jgi:hypothetical protein
VLATTLQLWAERRLRRPGWFWPTRARWRIATLLVLIAVVFAAGAITVALLRGPPAADRTAGGTSAANSPALSSAAIRAAAVARTSAAAWVVHQVAADAIVSCDPQMCAALETAGIPAGRLFILGNGHPDPLGSDVIVSTAAVRSQFGARLDSVYAPVVLASFGTGSAQAAIRVVAPDGAAAYLTSLRADVAARVSAGSQLLQNSRIHPSAAARQALAAGQVDSRLLTAFAALATMHTVEVLDFGAPAAGASPGMPLRSATLAPGPRGLPHRPNTLDSLASYLGAQLTPFRPAQITVLRLASGRSLLNIEFSAPGPLGLLGKN